MDFESALASPEIGGIIQSFLYADELVFAFNLSWDLRERFARDICDIRFGVEILRILRTIQIREAVQERATERYVEFRRRLALRLNPYYESDSESSSAGR